MHEPRASLSQKLVRGKQERPGSSRGQQHLEAVPGRREEPARGGAAQPGRERRPRWEPGSWASSRRRQPESEEPEPAPAPGMEPVTKWSPKQVVDWTKGESSLAPRPGSGRSWLAPGRVRVLLLFASRCPAAGPGLPQGRGRLRRGAGTRSAALLLRGRLCAPRGGGPGPPGAWRRSVRWVPPGRAAGAEPGPAEL